MKPGKYDSAKNLQEADFVEFGVHRSKWVGPEVTQILLDSPYDPRIPADKQYTVWVPRIFADLYWAETTAALKIARPSGGRARLLRRPRD